MKIHDITQELFTAKIYPGDPSPSSEKILHIGKGDCCNVTKLSLCVHNGTHMDAPYHFYENGETIDQVDLAKSIGNCIVIEESNVDMMSLIERLEQGHKRILLKGNKEITLEMAQVLNQYDIMLVGVESQSVGPMDSPMPVHLELLGKGVVLLEGLVLQNIKEGSYFLIAPPLKLGGSDGSPCRAVLLEGMEQY